MTAKGWAKPWIFLLVAFHGNAFAEGTFCSLDHVRQMGSGVALYFIPEGNVFVRVKKAGQGVSANDRMYQQLDGQMHRLYPNALQPEKAASEVVLLSGEEAFVGGGSHSSCTVAPAYNGHTFGVEMEASVGLPGAPPQTSSRFLPVNTL
ncbi:hypothetical protein [Dyella sp. C11]|uniref:hypothetical protein n=1 Tax=Dyella sp. C11 TaxID=2126991 RepID=UPI0013004721|nr:hypothetical protein [Dyella sp. C11]